MIEMDKGVKAMHKKDLILRVYDIHNEYTLHSLNAFCSNFFKMNKMNSHSNNEQNRFCSKE